MIDLYCDFETAFSKDYSLSRMPTAAYVRDPRFKAFGAAVAIPGVLEPTWLEEPKLRALLDALPQGKTRVIGHNLAFDAFILTEKYGFNAAAYHDTMHQSRYAIAQGHLDPEQRTSLASLAPLVGMTKGDTAFAVNAGGEELARYACEDLKATIALHHFLPQLPDTEAAISELHIRMAVEPRFCLDTDLLTTITLEQPDEDTKLLRSKANFAAALQLLGIEPETKQGKRGADYAFAKTDAFMKRLLTDEDPRAVALAEMRLSGASSIERTRAQRFLDIGSPINVPLTYYGALTGRAGGADKLNMQNLPARNGVPRLRQALMAPDGYSVLAPDSNQVEVRVLSWLAGDEATLTNYRHGVDNYAKLASEMYGKPMEECGDGTRERLVAKSARLGLQFGQRAKGFQIYCARNGVVISDSEAEVTVRRFEKSCPDVVRYWPRLEAEVRRDGGLTLPSGRRIIYSGLRTNGNKLEWFPQAIFRKTRDPQVEHLWHGSFCNNITQGTARDLVMEQSVRFDKALRQLGGAVVLSLHDEAVGIVPDDAVEDAKAAAVECFSWTPDWAEGLPVKGKAPVAKTYGGCK